MMEAIIFIAIAVIGVWILSRIGGDGDGAAQRQSLEALTVRIRKCRWDEDDDDSPMIRAVEGKGTFPHRRRTNISFITSLLHAEKPVLCPIEKFQEPKTIAYQHEMRAGNLEPGGTRDWIRLGVIIPVLIPPRGGKQRLTAVLRMIDADNPPTIVGGHAISSDSGIISQKEIKFDWTHDGKGYEEEMEHRDEARALSLKIAMATAMADGNLDNAEGGLMRRWILREISSYEGKNQERLKNLYNSVLRESFAEAKRGELDIDKLAARLNEIGEKSIKYEAMELCFDVMSADGVAHKAETALLRRLAQTLELDMHEVERMRDNTIIGMNVNLSDSEDGAEILLFDPNWDDARIKKHLRAKFAKWNARVDTLPAGESRNNAQRMLDLIAAERKKRDG